VGIKQIFLTPLEKVGSLDLDPPDPVLL